MIFIDASFYVSLLRENDSNHHNAIAQWRKLGPYEKKMTSQAVLGEVATVGSQRYDKRLTIDFIEEVQAGNTAIILESTTVVDRTWEIFKKIKSKNVSWVDCYSWAIIEFYKIERILTFDKDFQRLLSTKSKQ